MKILWARNHDRGHACDGVRPKRGHDSARDARRPRRRVRSAGSSIRQAASRRDEAQVPGGQVDPRGELQTHPSGRQRTRPYVELAATFPHHHRTTLSHNDTAIRHRRLNHKARWDTGRRYRAEVRGGDFCRWRWRTEDSLERKEANSRTEGVRAVTYSQYDVFK